jgi:hypothetical protein
LWDTNPRSTDGAIFGVVPLTLASQTPHRRQLKVIFLFLLLFGLEHFNLKVIDLFCGYFVFIES